MQFQLVLPWADQIYSMIEFIYMKVRTRFAPSPTGTPESVHLGFVIRALWDYAFAKKNGGQFILRLEDTDKKRSRKDTEEEIFAILKRFKIYWDEGPDIGGPYGPYRQSERLNRYQIAAHELVKNGYAYYDFDAPIREKEQIKESYSTDEFAQKIFDRPKARFADPAESKKRVEVGEKYVVRVKIPEDRVFEYTDCILKKKIKFFGKYVPDLIILKSDGYPTYHLGVVVDDTDMEISHVFRGQEWISTTPVHLYLYEGLGKTIPNIGHFTVILDPRTKKKFSKRDLTALFGVKHWQDEGYLDEAILNYLMLLGWAPKDNRELFTLDEFVQAFDFDGVQKANPMFNKVKIDWFNQQYIRKLSDEELANKVKNFTKCEDIKKYLPLVRDRLVTLKDFDALTDYFFSRPAGQSPLGGAQKQKQGAIVTHAISVLQTSFDGKILEEKAREFCTKENIKVGDYFMALRVAITGKTATPPLWEIMQILGKEESLERLKVVVK